MKNFTDKYLFTYSRGDRMMPVSNPHYVYKKRFLWERPLIIFLLILISILLLGCSPKEFESTRSKVPVEHSKHIYVRYNDGRIEYLGPVESIPYLVDIEHDNRLSREENLEIIRADGNRVTKKNQSASSDFQFEGFDRVIHHRNYIGILTGSRVMVPVYNEYQTTSFAWGLFILGFLFFISFFFATYYSYQDVRLIWNTLEDAIRKGSIVCLLSQLFLSVFGLLIVILLSNVLFNLKLSEDFIGNIFYSLAASSCLFFCFVVGSFAENDFKVALSFFILFVLSIFLYFVGASNYIAFYFTLIPAFFGIVAGRFAYFRKESTEYISERKYRVRIKNK